SRIARLRQLHGTRVCAAGSGACTPYPARRGTLPRACPPTIRALLRGRTAGCSRPDGYGEALDGAGPTGAQWRQSEAPHIMNHVLHGLAPLSPRPAGTGSALDVDYREIVTRIDEYEIHSVEYGTGERVVLL